MDVAWVARRAACLVAVAAATAGLVVAAAQAQTAEGGLNGERLFATSCGWCHSAGGRVAGKGPKLAGTDKSDEFIFSRIKNGKPGAMPAFRSLGDEKIKAIVAYIRTLKEEPQ